MGIKELVGKEISKEVNFMGTKIKVRKLTVAQVLEIQELSSKGVTEENDSMALLKTVIGYAVPDGKDLSEEDFRSFPIDELSKLSNEIMQYSGLGNDQTK